MTVSSKDALGDIILQRVLAERYDVQSIDSGKQVYVRNMDMKSKVSFWWSQDAFGKAPTTLTVSFIPTPERTVVKFTYELSRIPPSMNASWAKSFFGSEFKHFREHIEAWCGKATS